MSPIEVVGTVALAIVSLIKIAEQVWASKESRWEKVRRATSQSFSLVESLARGGALGEGMTKQARYFAEIARLLEAMGERQPTSAERRYMEEYARVRASTEHNQKGAVK